MASILHTIYHRVDGVYGFQNEDNSFTIIFKSPKSEIDDIKLFWNDPYNWEVDEGGKWWWKTIYTEVPISVESDDLFTYHKFILKSREGRFRYYFEFHHEKTTYVYGEKGAHTKSSINPDFNFHQFSFSWMYSSPGKVVKAPKWWLESAWYQVFPDRFASDKAILKTDNYDGQWGGNLKGLTSKLDYIASLGFNSIYLNPIFHANTSHKYDTIDYFKIDPQFGTMEDFENLVCEIKKRNMKIMLDGVFNHTGHLHPFWQDVLKNKHKSEYKDFFVIWDMSKIDSPENLPHDLQNPEQKGFSTFANTPFMPRLNFTNKKVQDYILKITEFWASKGIDAWRMDVGDEVSFDIWRRVKQSMKNINENFVILGEIWYDALPFLHGDQFDSVMNYLFRNNVIDFFIKKETNIDQFIKNMTQLKYKYSQNINLGLFNLIGTHDTDRVFRISEKNSDAKMAFAFLLLSQGVPSFYYGDENEMNGTNNRDIFDWNTTSTFSMVIKKLMLWRKKINPNNQPKYTLSKVGESLTMNYNETHVAFDFTNNTIKYKDEVIQM